ncbi:MAG: hypothetical protein K0S47_3495 [Herbinix sp.]|nr:hypothetical protein [Herbinix sp.]
MYTEMNNNTNSAIFIITGIMAAGKSTIAQLLAEKFQKGVHVRGDIYRKMIVTGREDMSPDPTEEALRQLKLRYKLAAATAEAYCNAGFQVIVQDNILGTMLQDFIEMFHNHPIYVIALCPSQEAVALREKERNKIGYGDWSISELDDLFQRETPRIGLWIDTSNQTPEESIEEILKRVWEEGRVK